MPIRLRHIAQDLAGLFYPPVCPVCGGMMGEGNVLICTYCRNEIPLTFFCAQEHNSVRERLWELQLPVVNAASFFFFVHGSGFRELVHTFKYRGGWKLAREMGEWFGAEIAAGGIYSDIDVIVPVPLHIRKRLRRGYNQAEYIAEGLASALGRPVDLHSVRRRVHNKSQTLSDRSKRWDNVAGIFDVRRPEALAGKHILLVDDVLTTGATLISCGREILSQVPDCRLSVATLAVSRNELLSAYPVRMTRKR